MVVKKTHEEYVIELGMLHPNIEILGTYNGSRVKIKHRCRIDNCVWDVSPSALIKRKIGCPRCSKNERYGHDGYIERLNKTNPNIEVLGEYINAKTPIKHKCKIDGYVWYAKPNHTLNGSGCRQCFLDSRDKKYTTYEYIQKVKEIHSNIEVIEDYKGIEIPIKHKCKIDNTVWEAKPNNIINNKTGCPKCGKSKSKGEDLIKEILDIKGIEYQQEYSFDDLISYSNRKLRYDFAIFNKKGEVSLLIEYDGEFHYKNNKFNKLQMQLVRDNIKSEYAKSKKIKLIRIPYWEFNNIENIINNVIPNGTKEKC